MGKAKKRSKPKGNRKNKVKFSKMLKNNREILSKIKSLL